MTDVRQAWVAAGGDAGSLPAPIQDFTATQNLALVSQIGAWSLNEAAVDALINALNTALGG